MNKLLRTAIPLVFMATSSISMAAVITGPFDSDSGFWTLIDNGNFENGLDQWSNPYSRGDFTLDSANYISPDHSTKSLPNVGFNGGGFALRHNVDVVAGETYVLSGFINTTDMQTGRLYIDLNDVSFDVNLGVGELSFATDEWQFLYQSFVPDTDFLTIRLVHDGNVRFGESGYFDDIAITLASDFSAPSVVAEPSMFALMAVGLVLIMVNGRRTIVG
jgi:hypothetical protein